jgi:hypothetical protein
VISFRCKAHKHEGMRRTHWYAAMSEDAVQRSRWTFYEVVNRRELPEVDWIGEYSCGHYVWGDEAVMGIW